MQAAHLPRRPMSRLFLSLKMHHEILCLQPFLLVRQLSGKSCFLKHPETSDFYIYLIKSEIVFFLWTQVWQEICSKKILLPASLNSFLSNFRVALKLYSYDKANGI